jgi:hypothetical protein
LLIIYYLIIITLSMTDFKVRCPSRILSSCGTGVHYDDSITQLGTNHVQGAIEALFDAGIEGPQGPAGPQGDQGLQGPQGAQGPQGTSVDPNIGLGFYAFSEDNMTVGGTSGLGAFTTSLAVFANDTAGMYSQGGMGGYNGAVATTPWAGYWDITAWVVVHDQQLSTSNKVSVSLRIRLHDNNDPNSSDVTIALANDEIPGDVGSPSVDFTVTAAANHVFIPANRAITLILGRSLTSPSNANVTGGFGMTFVQAA